MYGTMNVRGKGGKMVKVYRSIEISITSLLVKTTFTDQAQGGDSQSEKLTGVFNDFSLKLPWETRM